MLSSTQPESLIPKNLINEFFKIALTILQVRSTKDLEDQIAIIQAFEKKPTIWKNEFEEHSAELKECEENLIKTLYGICQFVRYRVGTSTVDSVKKYITDTSALKKLANVSVSPQLGIVYALNVHMAITAEFFYMMDEMWELDHDSTMMTMESVLKITEAVASLKKVKNDIIIYPSDVIPIQYCIEVIDSVDVLLKDEKPESQCRLYLLAINELIVNRLFKLRDKLQPEEDERLSQLRKLQTCIEQNENLSKTCKDKQRLHSLTTLRMRFDNEMRDIKTLLAICRDRRLQLDSLIYRLNLNGFADKRKKYNAHLNKYQMGKHYIADIQYARSKRVAVVSGLIGYHDPIYQIMCATQLLFIYLNHLEYTYFTYKVLEHEKEFNKLPIVNSILRQCKNIHFDCRVLLAQVAQYTLISEEAQLIHQHLNVILRASTCITYCLQSVPNELQLKLLLTVNYDDLDLDDLQSDSIASAFGSVLHVKNQAALDFAKDVEPRKIVIKRIKDELIDLIEKYAVLEIDFMVKKAKLEKFGNDTNVKSAFHSIYKKREIAAQFIMDYYMTALTSANSEAESSLLIDNNLVKKIDNLAIHPYHHLIYKLLCDQMKLRNEMANNSTESALIVEHETMVEMFEQCKDKLSHIHEAGNRINTNMFAYFLDKAGLVLGYMLENGDNTQKNAALILQYNLNHYLTNLYNQTIQYTDDIMPVDGGYIAVRLQEANFIDERRVVKLPTQTVPHKTNKKAQKKANAEINRANQAVTAKPVNLKPLQLIYKDFDQIVAQFKRLHSENYFNEMVKFFHSLIEQNRDHVAQLYAFVGAAQLLNFEFKKSEIEIKRRIALQEYLLDHGGKLLPLLTKTQEVTYVQAMKNWQECRLRYASTFYIIEKIITTITKPEPKVKKQHERKPKVVATLTLYSEQKSIELPPAPKDPFYDCRVDNNHVLLKGFKFPVSSIHQPLVDTLLQNNIATFAHGGSISDLVFKKQPRDLDLVCCTEKHIVIDLLWQAASRPELCIENIRENANNDIIVISFDKQKLQHNNFEKRIKNSDLRLEIHCRPLEPFQALLSMANNFILNTMFFYDFRCQSIIDVLHQFDNLFSKQVLSGLSDSLYAYFKKNKSRLLDIIYKLTRYFEYNADTANNHLDKKLCKILKKAKYLLNVKNDEPFQMEKFNKLFMQGHARQALLWLRHLKMEMYLFACLNEEDVGNLELACSHSDEYFSHNDFEYVSEEDMSQQRANFMVTAFYNCFIRTKDPLKYLLNMEAFYADCKLFYSSINFEMKYHQTTLAKIAVQCARRFIQEVTDMLYLDFIEGKQPYRFSDQKLVFEEQCMRHFLSKHVETEHINNTKLRLKIAEMCWDKHLIMIKNYPKSNGLRSK